MEFTETFDWLAVTAEQKEFIISKIGRRMWDRIWAYYNAHAPSQLLTLSQVGSVLYDRQAGVALGSAIAREHLCGKCQVRIINQHVAASSRFCGHCNEELGQGWAASMAQAMGVREDEILYSPFPVDVGAQEEGYKPPTY